MVNSARNEFWNQTLGSLRAKSTLQIFENPIIRATKGPGFKSQLSGVEFNFALSKKGFARAEVYICQSNRDTNTTIFDGLSQKKSQIHAEFGEFLDWDRGINRKACRISAEIDGHINQRENWPQIVNLLADTMIGLEKTFTPRLENLDFLRS